MDERVFWIWLQTGFGAGSSKPMQLVRRTGSAKAFYEGGVRLWGSFSFVSDSELSVLCSSDLKQAQAQLTYCESVGHTVITPDCDAYPPLLREIYAPPAVLYVKGNPAALSAAPSVAIVGTRKAGDIGLDAAGEFAYHLAISGYTIISGGALGIDAQAHRGALHGGGKTVAVLPCGLDYPYLMDNALLRRDILDRDGALVTEYPMNTPVYRGAFQVRNRLISGMSSGVIVAEAPEKSGALITAKHALEQNREVFAFPGDGSKRFSGCAKLIADGATAARTARDIQKALSPQLQATVQPPVVQEKSARRVLVSPKPIRLHDHEAPEKPAEPTPPPPVAVPEIQVDLSVVSVDAQTVYAVLDTEPRHIAQIETESGLSAAAVMAALTELELFGYLRTYPGQRFTKA